MPDVFISYARRDSGEFVKRLADALEADGVDVWVDLEDIPAASDWQRDLRDGVLQSDCFCFVVSPTSAASQYCLGELSDAESRNKRVIPLIHEPVAEAELPRLLQRLNWVPQRGKFADDFDANLKTLVGAIRTDLEATRAHTRWEAAAAEWEERSRDASLLPRGSELREAEHWIATQVGRDPAPTALQAEFVQAARRANERRRRLVFGLTAAALVVSVALGIVALLQRNEARDQRDIANSNALASSAQANLDSDPELSAILGKAAVETVDTPRAEQALAQGLSQSLLRVRISDPGPRTVQAAGFSADDRLIVTAGGSGVLLWDAKTGESVRELTTEPAYDAEFAPDSKTVAVAGADGTLAVYEAGDGTRTTSIQTGSPRLYAVAVSPDGKLVAASGVGGFAASYDIATEHATEFDGHGDAAVNSVEYSPNSRVVLSVGDDGAARLWYADTAEEVAVLESDGEPVLGDLALSIIGAPSSDAAFGPNGESVATVNNDGSVSLWSLTTAEPKATPITEPGDGFFYGVAFDFDRDAVIVNGISRADAYDLRSGDLVATYRGHSGVLNQANVSADGSRVVTAGEDGTARVWAFNQVRFSGRLPILVTDIDFDSEGKRIATSGLAAVIDVPTATAEAVPFEKRAAVAYIAFDPSANRLALADTDGIVQFVDPETGEPRGPEIDPPQDFITQVAFDDSGSRLMVRVLGGGVYVYDTETGEQIGAVTPLTIAAAFSPDGTLVAHFGADTKSDKALAVTDLETGEDVARLSGHTAAINSVAFSGDGTKVVTGSDDGTARIWDTDTENQLARLSNEGLAVKTVAFSDDGHYVATTGNGLAVFDARTGREVMRVPGFEQEVVFSPDNRLIAALGPDSKHVSVIDCDVCVSDVDELMALADERITRDLSERERAEYLGADG